MKKNTLLSFATLFGNLFSIVLILTFVALTGVFVHYQVKPETYKGVMVQPDSREFTYSETVDNELPSTKGGNPIKVSRTLTLNEGASKGKVNVPLENVYFGTLLFIYLQMVAKLALLFLITAQILKVITSVRELDTFRDGNVQAFRNIGFMCLGLSFIQWFSFFYAEGHSAFKFGVEFTPLIFMLGAFILAEIFKEGNKLYEQEQLTI